MVVGSKFIFTLTFKQWLLVPIPPSQQIQWRLQDLNLPIAKLPKFKITSYIRAYITEREICPLAISSIFW
jgi:hypothetical protein